MKMKKKNEKKGKKRRKKKGKGKENKKKREKGKGKRIGRKVTRRNGGERVNKMGRKWMKNEGERRKRKKKEEEEKKEHLGAISSIFFSVGLHQQVLVGGASSISLRDFTIFFWTALAFATVLDASARAVRDNEADRRLQP